MGISLWLVPSPETAKQLSTIAFQPPPSLPSSTFSFPSFGAHITLATVPSTTSISEIQSAIPSNQSSIPITFKSLDVGSKHFKSVYVAVYDSTELVALRDHLKEKLGENTLTPPAHMSLFYGEDAGHRQTVADQLKGDRHIVEVVDGSVKGLELDCSPGDERNVDLIRGFTGSEIWIVLCDGPPNTWESQVKAKIPLS